MNQPEKRWCQTCQLMHPVEEMKRVRRKGITVWKCLKVLEWAKRPTVERDEYGKTVTELNKAAKKDLRILRGQAIKEGRAAKRTLK